MESATNRRPVLAVISIAAALTSYALVTAITILAFAARRLGFNGVDVLFVAVTAICVFTMFGFYLGILSVYRYRRGGWTPLARRLSFWGVALNGVNSLLLYLLSKF